ncbi:MAG: DNA cytosine methyltransferase, partial [Alphaproteobacteria bacterium]|nr:DNA cytosine methyltransferase [Alphaproteobacteria bacterium]
MRLFDSENIKHKVWMNGMALSASRSVDADGGGRSLRGISLCAGVGGLDLGLHIAIPNYRTVCYVERDAYAAATLVARMENTALDRAP